MRTILFVLINVSKAKKKKKDKEKEVLLRQIVFNSVQCHLQNRKIRRKRLRP